MIRPLTCLCLAAAFGSGLYLYSEKHRTSLLDRQISGLVHQTEAARQRTGLLRAEWALLNEPGRLQDMADKYLALKPMAPTQFVSLADLSQRLPPPLPEGTVTADDQTDGDDDGTAPAGTAPVGTALAAAGGDVKAADGRAALDQAAPGQAGPDKAAAGAAALADAGKASAEAGKPGAHGTAARTMTVRLASARQGGKPGLAAKARTGGEAAAATDAAMKDAAETGAARPALDEETGAAAEDGQAPQTARAETHQEARGTIRQLARNDSRPKPARHGTMPAYGHDGMLAYGHDGMLARGTPLPLAAPQPMRAQVYSAMARPMPQVARPAVIAASPHYAPSYIGSALAGSSLPPPTPYNGDR